MKSIVRGLDASLGVYPLLLSIEMIWIIGSGDASCVMKVVLGVLITTYMIVCIAYAIYDFEIICW
jgi:hypothetical protein